MRKITLFILFSALFFSVNAADKRTNLSRSKAILDLILKHYTAEDNHLLFNETYPFDPKNVVSYTVNEDKITKKRVAYLWPTSGILSGVVSLMEADNYMKHKTILDTLIVPGLNLYFDKDRVPDAYQSYLKNEGNSDRFYDDNVWLVIDFADTYLKSRDKRYLEKAIVTWNFVLSGWDDKLDGGIYWCEQRKNSKNTCSNAPSVVAAMKLYEGTGDQSYLDWAEKIYNWTKKNLQDESDFLYYDNINLKGRLDKVKYAYNSGQMLQGAVLLYKTTGNKYYLEEAQNLAKSCYKYFFTEFTPKTGNSFQLMKKGNVWFYAVMFRGFVDLYEVDGNKEYMVAFQHNLDYAWDNMRNAEGLFNNEFTAESSGGTRWLLTQAAYMEMYAKISVLSF